MVRLKEYFEKNLSGSKENDEYAVFAVFSALRRSYKYKFKQKITSQLQANRDPVDPITMS